MRSMHHIGTEPVLHMSPTSFTDFTSTPGVASAYKTFTISGDNLLANVNVSVGDNFEISTSPTGEFGSSVLLTVADGNIIGEPVTLYFRMASTAELGTNDADLVVSSSGATTITIPISGIVAVPTPTLTVNQTSLPAFNTTAGTASSYSTFTVSGQHLTSNVTVTAPSHYELSTSSGGPYTSPLTLIPADGVLATTTIYARISASASTGTPSGNITISATGATTKNVAVSGTVTAPGGLYDTIQVNFYDSANNIGKILRPAPDLWNNYSVALTSTLTSNNPSAYLQTKTGTATGVRVQWIANTSTVNGYSDNTNAGAQSNYGAGNTMNFPDSVFQSARFSTQSPSTMNITGLDDGKTYKIRAVVSRNSATSRPVTYTLGEQSVNVNAALNLTDVIEFENVTPVGGTITISITFTNQFSYCNALQIIYEK